MNDYIELLALSYFRKKQNNYEIHELMQILGFGQQQIDELIQKLITKNFIEYNMNLLQVTEKGLNYLLTLNCNNCDLNEDSYELFKLDKENVLSISNPYVPEKFLKKI